MNTLNDYNFRIKQLRSTPSKALYLIHKMLVVISVYIIFGLLFQYI